MKKFYEEPLAELIKFDLEDIMESVGGDYVIGGGNGTTDDDFGDVTIPLF